MMNKKFATRDGILVLWKMGGGKSCSDHNGN